MNNTLIDNSSEALSMTATLKKCLATDGIRTVSIATGYWDIPGLTMLQEEIKSFIEKDGTTLRLLIWKSRSNLTLCGERKLTPRQNKIDPINVLAAGGNFILSIL